MKKKLGIFVGIIVLIFAIFLFEMLFRKINNRQWDRRANYLNELKNTNKYNIKRITNKKLVYQFGNDAAQIDTIPNYATAEELQALYNDTTTSEEKIDSYIYVDTLRHNLWIETTEYISSEDSYSDYEQWLNIDFNGNIIEKREDSTMQKSAELVKLKLIDSEISNFYDSNDNKSAFFVNHFAKVEFQWSLLNPWRGMGNPTGGSATTYWRGMAYLNLKMKQEMISFKTETKSTTDGYNFEIDLYRLPAKYTNGKEVALVYIDHKYLNDKDCGLYLIMAKNSIK